MMPVTSDKTGIITPLKLLKLPPDASRIYSSPTSPEDDSDRL